MNVSVAGHSRGAGLEICRVLLEQDNTVYGVIRSYTDEFKALEVECVGKLFFKSIDLSDSGSIRKSAFKEFVGNKVVFDAYVSNAAMAYDDIVTNLNLDRLKAMYAVNVFTPMMMTKCAIHNMLLYHTRGSIVHISSTSVRTGYKGLAMYASSKGALEASSKDTTREWGGMGICSNMVVPGFMETVMSSTLTGDQKDRIYKRTSIKVATSACPVAETASFLVSERAYSITGQNIHVDNGTI